MEDRFAVAVLVSGAGTNLQAILDTVHGRDGVEVVAVASSSESARALDRAAAAGVESAAFEVDRYDGREQRDGAMAGWLAERGVDLVVLAGFMQLLTPGFLSAFPQRVINVHPSLLPAFPGPQPIEDQIAYGVRVGGVTVHFVDAGVDSGPVILQEPVRLPYTRDPAQVRELLHRTEHELLPRAIGLIARGAVRFDSDNPRFVHVDESVLEETQ
jgi:phosphoribosylglycinamide formyltransferase 1